MKNEDAIAHRSQLGPRDPVELRLTRIWEKWLETHPINIRDDFFMMGGDSVSALRIVNEMRASFGRPWQLSILFEAPTIETLAQVVRTRADFKASLVPVREKQSGTPIILIHPLGGDVLRMCDLILELRTEKPIYAVQSPSLYSEDYRPTTIPAMASAYLREIQTVWKDGPYILGGLSFGSAVAYEMACQLEAQGNTAALVLLLGPTTLSGDGKTLSHVSDEADKILYRLLVEEDRPPFEDFLQITSEAKVRLVAESWKGVDLFPSESTTELVRGVARASRINAKALQEFRPRTYRGQVAAFCAEDDPEDLATRGWPEQLRYELIRVPGTHESFVYQPQVMTLAREIEKRLDLIQG